MIKSNLRQKIPFTLVYCASNGQITAATHDTVLGSIWRELYNSRDFENKVYQVFSVTPKAIMSPYFGRIAQHFFTTAQADLITHH